jgi:hypothetical protein
MGELIRLLISEAKWRGCPAETRAYWRRNALSDPQLVAGGLKDSLTPRVFSDVVREQFGYRSARTVRRSRRCSGRCSTCRSAGT